MNFRTLTFCAIFTLIHGGCFSQNTFSLNSGLGSFLVLINGKQYSIDSNVTKVPTHYPKFDTLIFKKDAVHMSVPILCNFKPDINYSITMGCCATPDIAESSKLNCDSCQFWSITTDIDKIHRQFVDKPFISIRTKSQPKDSIYAWHADATIQPQYKLISAQLWRFGIPPKGFYWSNISTFTFFKPDPTLPKHDKNSIEEFLGMNNITELASVSLRLFDDQRFILTFDEQTNSILLEYE